MDIACQNKNSRAIKIRKNHLKLPEVISSGSNHLR